MTVTKESLREALVEFDAWEDGSVNSLNDLPLVQAARFVERLLPAPCPKCGETIHCSTNDQLWDEGLVEVVAKAIALTDDTPELVEELKPLARTVLAAFAHEVGR